MLCLQVWKKEQCFQVKKQEELRTQEAVDLAFGEWIKLAQGKQTGDILNGRNDIRKSVASVKCVMYIETLSGSVWLKYRTFIKTSFI